MPIKWGETKEAEEQPDEVALSAAPVVVAPVEREVVLDPNAPDMRVWLRRFAAALRAGDIHVEDRKSSRVMPMVPRKAQLSLLRRMIEMADRGQPIRIIVPKARQEGISTFVQDLYDWLCEYIPNYRAITMAHTHEDTSGIFRKAKVCYENLPGAREAIVTGTTIRWPNGSEYRARTAGSKAIGRGDTFQLMHFSELAYCERIAGMAAEAITSAINTVPREPHTIVIIESTGDGPAGAFYDRCMDAQNPENPFDLLFFPWHDDDEYREAPPDGWEVPDDLRALQGEYNLDLAQMYYYHLRRLENKSRSGNVASSDAWFRREYPSTLMDCFMAATGRVFPDFGDRHIRDLGEPRGDDWKIYRGFDWGQTTDPTVCLWISHDPTKPPGLIVHPSCFNTIREMQAYRMDESPNHANYPRDKDNHCPDCIRMVVVTARLTGLVYVFKEYYKYDSAAIRLDGIARDVHALTGWRVPEGSEMTLGAAVPGPDAYIIEDSIGDRSQPMYMSMLSNWGIPCHGQSKPIEVPGVKQRGEILDGCMLVSVLIGGTTKFYKDKIDVSASLYEQAFAKKYGPNPIRLTDAEAKILEKHNPFRQARKVSKYRRALQTAHA